MTRVTQDTDKLRSVTDHDPKDCLDSASGMHCAAHEIAAAESATREAVLEEAIKVMLKGLLPGHRDLYMQEVCRLEHALEASAETPSGAPYHLSPEEQGVMRRTLLKAGKVKDAQVDDASTVAQKDYVLVPREPTDAMRLAGDKCLMTKYSEGVYKAMLDAYPPVEKK